MKIGIVTQPLWGNYGGILQNYALQEVLRQLGHEPLTLDFMWGYKGFRWQVARAKRVVAKLLGRGGSWHVDQAPKRHSKPIDDFVNRHIAHTPYFWNTYSPRLVAQNRLDAVIAGSDQVWRPCYNPQLACMFLSFTRKAQVRRIAYAASFGTAEWEYTEAQRRQCAKLLKRFDAVSVREKSGVTLAARLGREAVQVLDPTLLLGREGFEKLLPEDSGAAKTTLGAYILDTGADTAAELERIRTAAQCEEVELLTENLHDVGPAEWVAEIRGSRFFVTDSFHGTIFCILFHVPFVTVVNTARGADRFFSLLEPIGLRHRMVERLAEVGPAMETPIEWDEVDKALSAARSASLEFLKNTLS